MTFGLWQYLLKSIAMFLKIQWQDENTARENNSKFQARSSQTWSFIHSLLNRGSPPQLRSALLAYVFWRFSPPFEYQGIWEFSITFLNSLRKSTLEGQGCQLWTNVSCISISLSQPLCKSRKSCSTQVELTKSKAPEDKLTKMSVPLSIFITSPRQGSISHTGIS